MSKTFNLTIGKLRHIRVTASRWLLFSKQLPQKKITRSASISKNKLYKVHLMYIRFLPLIRHQSQNIYEIKMFRGASEYSFFVRTENVAQKFIGVLEKLCPKLEVSPYYTKHSEIGSGAYASVYKMEQKSTGKFFAGKFIDMKKARGSLKVCQSIDNEISILTSLSHPGIPEIHDIIVTPSHLVIVMNYIEGPGLFQVLKTDKQPSQIEEGVAVLRALIEILNYMHKKGIIHRDIKPENIILSKGNYDKPVLIDFGFAVNINKIDMSVRCGTPGYVPPEVFCFFSQFTDKSDIFSLGVTFFMLMARYFPFPGKTQDQILDRNRKVNIYYKKEVWNEIAPDGIFSSLTPSLSFCFSMIVKSVILWMMEKEPQDRPSCEDFLSIGVQLKAKAFLSITSAKMYSLLMEFSTQPFSKTENTKTTSPAQILF